MQTQSENANIRHSYWKKKVELGRKAKEWNKNICLNYKEEIANAVHASKIYSPGYSRMITPCTAEFIFENTDSVTAAFKYGNGCILNFASYKNPGGAFMNGSSAQEESLCHESILYPILNSFSDYYNWNTQHKNKALYTDRAIYTPNVTFIHNGETRKFDVLTCAAPNIATANKYLNITDKENVSVLRKRVKFIYDILDENNIKTFITGAWGCGVFGQDPETVKKLFMTTPSSLERIVFAVPGNSKNTEVFKG